MELANTTEARSQQTAVAALFSRHAVGLWGTVLLARALEQDLESRSPGTGQVVAQLLPQPLEQEVEEGAPLPLLELCLRALTELGGDDRSLRSLGDSLRAGRCIDDALCLLSLPEEAKQYITSTLEAVTRPTHMMVARMLHALEPILAQALGPVLVDLETARGRTLFWTRRYLARCAANADQTETLHGLLQELCGNEPGLWTEALASADGALRERLALLG